jgi:hypothetical protein
MVTAAAALLSVVTLAGQEREIGRISFFGQDGFDVAAIKAVLPYREGSRIPYGALEGAALEKAGQIAERVDEAVTSVIGRGPTDLATVCCDEAGRLLIYIGLPGKSVHPARYNAPPSGTSRVPADVESLHAQLTDLLFKAVLERRADEDRSEGYALATNNPALRDKQLEWRDAVRRHEPALFSVATSARDPSQRRLAATAMGYLRPGDRQIAALVSASFDPDDGVRNNAVRALAVLLTGKPELSRRVPGRRFIDLLSSGTWSDRNKGLAVIEVLVARREAGLLRDLRARASTPLLEMAQWPWMHARPARVILGRIIGIPEQQLGAVADEEPPITLLRRFRER